MPRLALSGEGCQLIEGTISEPVRAACRRRRGVKTAKPPPTFGLIIGQALPGPPGHYQSVIVAHADDPRDAAGFDRSALAVNDGRSQSGWAAALDWAAETGVSFRTILTGSHRASAQAVANREAELAAIVSADKTFIRLNWEYNHGQELIDYHREINGEQLPEYTDTEAS